MNRTAPIVTARQLSLGLTLVDDVAQILAFDYCDGIIPYTARLKVKRVPDGLFVMCCACGCFCRQLFKHPTRCGLACIDCCSRAEHKSDHAAERRPAVRKTSKKADEVAAKRTTKRVAKPRKKAA